MIDVLTVKEMLMYTAELKRPQTESYARKEEVVDHFIGSLALDGCKDIKIGNSLNRCGNSLSTGAVAQLITLSIRNSLDR